MQPGVSLHLKCIASGNPTPEINWELDSKRLSSTERSVKLKFKNINFNDF